MGDGIYRSTDGGDNLDQLLGLPESERIAKILVDPKDGNTVYACATGHAFNDSLDRGVYKTTDGGKTWRKVLAGMNPATGCAMMSMNKEEPGYDLRHHVGLPPPGLDLPPPARPGSGIFKSTDKGENLGLEINLPLLPRACQDKPYGRIALSAAPSLKSQGHLRDDRVV